MAPPPQQSNSSPMQLQPQQNQQPTTLSNLQKFLSNYNKFIEQNITINLNPHIILSDIALNLLEPPKSISQQENTELFNLFIKGKKLPQALGADSKDMQEVTSRLKKLKDDKLYDTIEVIQKLNSKLNKDYEREVNRGVEIGVYSRKVAGQGNGEALVGSHKMEKSPHMVPFATVEKQEKSIK